MPKRFVERPPPGGYALIKRKTQLLIEKERKMKKTEITAVYSVPGDLFWYCSEDGPVTGQEYWVIAETATGERYSHHAFFRGEYTTSDGMRDYCADRAQAQASHLQSRVAQVGFINLDHWEKCASYSHGEVCEASLMDTDERERRGC